MENLNAIFIFAKVVETGSLSAAARVLKIPKSTVSRRLSSLEDELGAQLIVRTTRTLDLTEVGRAFYERCKRIVADVAEAEHAVKETTQIPRGTLRVTVPADTATHAFSGLVLAFLERHPDVQIDLLMTNHTVNLAEEGFDIAIRAGALLDGSLVARRLNISRTFLVASPAYLEAHGVPEAPEDLRQHQALLLDPNRDTATWQLGPHAVTVRGRLRANNLVMLKRAALAGLGFAMLPEMLIRDELDEGRLHSVFDDLLDTHVSLHAVYLPNRHLSPKVRAFIDLAVVHFEKMDWEGK